MDKKRHLIRTLKRQLGDIGKYNKRYIFIRFALYTIIGGVFPLIGVIIPRFIIDELNVQNINMEHILYLCSFMGIVMAVLGFLKDNLLQITYVDFLEIRMKSFGKCLYHNLKIDYSYMEDPKFEDQYEINTRTLQNDEAGYEGTFHTLFPLGASILSLVIYVVIISRLSVWVLLSSLVATILGLMVSQMVKKYRYKNRIKEERSYRRKKYFEDVTTDFSYGKDIRVYGMKERILKSYDKESSKYKKIQRRFLNNEFNWSLLSLIGTLIQDAVSYYIVIDKAVNGAISIGELSMYLATITLFSLGLKTIFDSVSNIIEWLGYTKDYYDYLDNKALITNLEGIKKEEGTLEIEFQNVSFKYPNTDNYILKNFNFKIEKGTHLAIVGVNGAGKSTIVKLITGLFSPVEGRILVNGHDIKEYNTYEYRRMFQAVYQDINIFPFSILENVSMQKKEDTDIERVKDALKRVGLLEFVENLENGLDTPLLKVIDDNGIEMSGGQNQKLAIARALYKKGNMVILDEPTAALDALAEADIYKSFSDLVSEKTAIYISHRLASTKFCDKIALFSSNGLLEYGSHDELMNLKGKYYEMFVIQGKYYQEGANEDEEC